MNEKGMISLPDAACRIQAGYRASYELALAGKLGSVERRGGRLFVEAAAVERLRKERAKQATAGAA